MVTPGPSLRTAVRLLNLSDHPVNIHAGTVIAVLIPARVVDINTDNRKPWSGAVPDVDFSSKSDVACELLRIRLGPFIDLFEQNPEVQPHPGMFPSPSEQSQRITVEGDLSSYLAECRPGSNTFPFFTDFCAIRTIDDASWHLATSYADRHIPIRFHAVLQLPSESQVTSSAPPMDYVTTLTPSHCRSRPMPLETLRRLFALCTMDFRRLSLPRDYADAVATLESHVSATIVIYAPAIVFATNDPQDPEKEYLAWLDERDLRLDAGRSTISQSTRYGLTTTAHRRL